MRILLILLILFPASLWATDPLVPEPSPFKVHLFPYALKKDGEPMVAGEQVGKLIFHDAVELKSESYRFGGFSALNMIDGKLFALSDDGRLLRAKLTLKENHITDLPEASFDTLWPANEGEPAKKEYDAEALAHLKGDHFAVAFEQKQRIGFYTLGKKIQLERTLNAPDELNYASKPNEGIEALTALSPTRLLAITEATRDDNDNTVAYIVDTKQGAWQKLAIQSTKEFRPTDLAVFDDKHLLLLERSYSAINGVRARISLIKRKDIAPGAVVETTELARFNNQSGIDNMEGISVVPNKDGSKDIFVISDDNFNPLQHTILVWLSLPKLPRLEASSPRR